MSLQHQPFDSRFSQPDTIGFVIGGQKCGTTWLHQYFRTHPQVCVPTFKEPNYWRLVERPNRTDIHKRTVLDNLRQRGSWLKRTARSFGLVDDGVSKRMRGVKLALDACEIPDSRHGRYADVWFENWNPDSRIIVEASPQYALLKRETYECMSQLGQNVRFLFLLRNPADRFESGIRHALRGFQSTARHYDKDDLEGAVAKALKANNSPAKRKTMYHQTMDRLEKAVPEDRIKYVFFENLFQQDTTDEICDFLNIATRPAALDVKANVDTQPSIRLSDDLKLKITEEFKETYLQMHNRFGTDLPEKWRTSMARIGLSSA